VAVSTTDRVLLTLYPRKQTIRRNASRFRASPARRSNADVRRGDIALADV